MPFKRRVKFLRMTDPYPCLPNHLLTLQSHDGAEIAVSLFGGQLCSWRTPDGRERLFVSRHAHWDNLHPIRGGVPVIFPQFGAAGPWPRHGIARTLMWTLASQSSEYDQPACMKLQLTSRLASRETLGVVFAPDKFSLQLTIEFSGNTLRITLDIENTGTTSLTFCAALHTYLRCQAARSSIWGLQHKTYHDAVDNDRLKIDEAKVLRIAQEIDRLYLNTSSNSSLNTSPNTSTDIELRDDTGIMTLSQSGFSDTVVWNPWADKTRSLTDCAPQDYLDFVCIEAAVAVDTQQLRPGQKWRGTQSLRANNI